MHYLYKITNILNGKCYIGQATDFNRRWNDHKKAAKAGKPTQIIHHALIKHGVNNFTWEVIACCLTSDDANIIETLLVTQHNSYIKHNGYNATLGGMNAPKTEEWKQQLRAWHASLTPEEKAIRSAQQSEFITKYIEENGHPALGTKRTPEQKIYLSYIQQNERKNNYTPEMRQMFSEVNSGRVDPPEIIAKRTAAVKKVYDKRKAEEIASGSRKCHAGECDEEAYGRYEGVWYCCKHYNRLYLHGTLVTKTNRLWKQFTEEQMINIVNDPRGCDTKSFCEEYDASPSVLKRIRKQYSHLKKTA